MEHCTADELVRLSFLAAFTYALNIVPEAEGWLASGFKGIFTKIFLKASKIPLISLFFYSFERNVKSGDHQDPLSRCMSVVMREMYIKRVLCAKDYFEGLGTSEGRSQPSCLRVFGSGEEIRRNVNLDFDMLELTMKRSQIHMMLSSGIWSSTKKQ